ncbi:MAG: ABC transporter substrate-binding protein [Rhodospirillaceae bacterium]|nr:ABC transporter substrate-binding protein [Rhodospirillaceae bacterium]MCY4237023.1 ABC transporter substrate-binding protein [Rhodospirillaceae bacterium]
MQKVSTSLILAGTVALAGAAEAREYRVGFIAPKSGGAAQLGEALERGARLYIKLHQKDLGEHTVKLIVRDSKRPGGPFAKAAAQELIAREKVDILGGVVFSPNAMSIAPLATAGKVPFVVMNAGTSWITKLSPNIVRVSFTMWQAGFIMGEHAARALGCKTAISGYTNYPPGKDSAAAFKRGFEGSGGKVIDSIPMGGPRNAPDFTPFFQRVKDKRPNCFFVFVPGGNHAAAASKTYVALNMKAANIKFIGPGDLTHDLQLQSIGPAIAGTTIAVHYHADLRNNANDAYKKAFAVEYGAKAVPDFVSIGGYDGMAAVFAVIKAAKGGNITAEGALKTLKGWTHDSPRGKIMIDPTTRDIVQNIYIANVVNDNGILRHQTIKTIPGVKDKCKELGIGRCGK